MNCKEFKIEFEETRVLSETATLHIGECPDCKVLHFELTRVWRMLEALPRVEAPNDFDFRLKARIATAESGDFQPRWWYALRYVVPVLAAALVLTLVLASQNFFITSPETARDTKENQEKQIEIPQQSVVAPSESIVAENNSANEEEKPPVVTAESGESAAENFERESIVLASDTKDKERGVTQREKIEDGGGSRVISAEPSKVFILPRGIENTNSKPIENPSEVTKIKPIFVENLLSEIGIETFSENGKRKVKSVRENSPAQRSGVQVGDEIEAIDDNKLDKPIESAAIKVKVLTVTRNGEIMKIPLSSEPQ